MEFRTPTGYRQQGGHEMTEAMEDYLEMIYRREQDGGTARVSELAALLHVRPSSASRMVGKLTENGYLQYVKYGHIGLTEKGREMGRYLLWRHGVLQRFFTRLNGTAGDLREVEQIEHFMSVQTVRNLDRLLQRLERDGVRPGPAPHGPAGEPNA